MVTESRKTLERRRLEAVRMFQEDHSQGLVVRQLMVSRTSVSRWRRAWKRGESLLARRAPGRPRRLTPPQEMALAAVLRSHARMLSGREVAELVEQRYGVRFDRDHALRLRNFLLGRSTRLAGRVVVVQSMRQIAAVQSPENPQASRDGSQGGQS